MKQLKIKDNQCNPVVDFYEVNGRIYLGEMTFTPGAFIFTYGRSEDEIAVGNLLNI